MAGFKKNKIASKVEGLPVKRQSFHLPEENPVEAVRQSGSDERIVYIRLPYHDLACILSDDMKALGIPSVLAKIQKTEEGYEFVPLEITEGASEKEIAEYRNRQQMILNKVSGGKASIKDCLEEFRQNVDSLNDCIEKWKQELKEADEKTKEQLNKKIEQARLNVFNPLNPRYEQTTCMLAVNRSFQAELQETALEHIQNYSAFLEMMRMDSGQKAVPLTYREKMFLEHFSLDEENIRNHDGCHFGSVRSVETAGSVQFEMPLHLFIRNKEEMDNTGADYSAVYRSSENVMSVSLAVADYDRMDSLLQEADLCEVYGNSPADLLEYLSGEPRRSVVFTEKKDALNFMRKCIENPEDLIPLTSVTAEDGTVRVYIPQKKLSALLELYPDKPLLSDGEEEDREKKGGKKSSTGKPKKKNSQFGGRH